MLEKAKEQLLKAEQHLEHEFSKLQVGRANPALVEEILVDSYWTMQAIQAIASVTTMDAQTLNIKPWDKSVITAIAKAISEAWIWLNPQTMADSIIIKIPSMTEERRKDIVKVAKKITEDSKISIRNIRQDLMKEIKNAEDNKEISEDEKKSYESDLQELVNKANKKVEELFKTKEADIMKI